MSYRRALKLAIIPWLIVTISFTLWFASQDPSAAEVRHLGWRLALAFVGIYFGMGGAIQRISEIVTEANRHRR